MSERVRDWSGLREAAERATPGPWEAFRRGDPNGPFGVCAEVAGDVDPDVFDGATRENATFIVAANPAAITELLDELDAARDALGRVRALADEWDRKARVLSDARRVRELRTALAEVDR